MSELGRTLAPPATKGHVSVARLSQHWYVACQSQELGSHPIARTIIGTPLVLFRDDKRQAGALLDRCPHRNVPLSLGRVSRAGHLECAYHGWQFDGGGTCRLVPGLIEESSRERRAPAFRVRERDGLVWVYATPDVEPRSEPFQLPLSNARGYVTVQRRVQAEATLHATVENALDVPHTAFLHRGLFRTTKTEAEKNVITAIVRRSADRVEAEYLGEPLPTGAVVRLLSPSGGTVQHWDRFILPSVAQVEYRLGTENHFLVTALCTPETDFVTRLYAVVSFRLRVPAALVKPLIEPLALRIFNQDAAILKRQSDTIREFGGEQFMSTEIDVLGPDIWRLLKHAERGDPQPEELVAERRVTLRV
jgi:phenylpropionate dioxygenase-like ring-hydroxylating dioxygenase large terminal subunit